MKWTSHKILTGAIVFAFTGNAMASIFAAAGSILPDAIETQNRANRNNHRKISHWFVPYLLGFLYLQGILEYYQFRNLQWDLVLIETLDYRMAILLGTWIISMFLLGACLHIFEDALCGQVPGVFYKKWIGVRLFSNGSFKEYLFVSVVSFLLFNYRLQIL